MFDLKAFDTTIEKVREIISLDTALRAVEDKFLETWLMVGMPDDMTLTELFEDIDEYYVEWSNLGSKLLAKREKR